MSKSTLKLFLVVCFFALSIAGNANSSLPGNEPGKKFSKQHPSRMLNTVYRLTTADFMNLVKEKFKLPQCESNYINGHAYLDLSLYYMGTWCDTNFTGFDNWYCHDQLYNAYLEATTALYYQYLSCEGGVPGMPV